MKAIAWLAGIGTLVAGTVYMVVSLNRWEWNRALFFGLIVVIVVAIKRSKANRLRRQAATVGAYGAPGPQAQWPSAPAPPPSNWPPAPPP